MRQQRGVALIQVLLITIMLLILTVQLSKDARSQVKTAILLKNKAEITLAAHSAKERIKFELLTANKNRHEGVAGIAYNFHGKPVKQGNQSITMQDEDGFVSTVYGGATLRTLLGNDDDLFKQVARYQGNEETARLSPGDRGGPLPALKELKLLPFWDDTIATEGMTQLPTFQFNLFNTPEALLTKLYGGDRAAALIGLRNRNNLSTADWQLITGNEEDYLVGLLPGNFITLTVSETRDNLEIIRKTRLMMNFDIEPAIAEITVE